MGRRQKGKHMKRGKGWHRGDGEEMDWTKAAGALPVVDEVAPDLGAPRVVRGVGKRLKP